MRLYHATWPTNLRSIRSGGIRPNGFEGVYLAGKAHHAAGFLALRGVEYGGMETKVIDGVSHTIPKIIKHDSIIIFEVDTARLDKSLLTDSSDHNSSMYPADLKSYVYDGHIPPSAITDVLTVDT